MTDTDTLNARTYDALMAAGQRLLADEFADANGALDAQCEHCHETDSTVLDYSSDGGPVAHPDCIPDMLDAQAPAYMPRASIPCPAHGDDCHQGEHCPAL